MQVYNAEKIILPAHTETFLVKSESQFLFREHSLPINGQPNIVPAIGEAVDILIRNRSDEGYFVRFRFRTQNPYTGEPYWGDYIELNGKEKLGSSQFIVTDIMLSNPNDVSIVVEIVIVGRR